MHYGGMYRGGIDFSGSGMGDDGGMHRGGITTGDDGGMRYGGTCRGSIRF